MHPLSFVEIIDIYAGAIDRALASRLSTLLITLALMYLQKSILTTNNRNHH